MLALWSNPVKFAVMSIAVMFLATYSGFVLFAEGTEEGLTFTDDRCYYPRESLNIRHNQASYGSDCTKFLCNAIGKELIILGCPPPEGEENVIEFPGFWPDCCKTKHVP
uniref:Putative secreted protein n=1 Tax=Amblyomma cajennense TaxID=34607 RepID=A0A023FEP6_AMBCJ